MPFKVLIDLGKLKTLFSGLGQFSYYFGKHISNMPKESFFWNFLTPDEYVDLFGINWNYEKLTLKRKYFPGLCNKYDLWHAIHQDSSFFPSNLSTPYILTIHDLNFLQEKHGFKVRRRLENLQKKVNRASYITFVSNYTAQIANKNLDLNNKPQKVIYNGVDIETEKITNKPTFIPDGKFLFTIGIILEKKNFIVLVDFMNQLPDYNLIIAGDKNSVYANQLQTKINQKKLTERIFLPGIITEEDKIYLYRHCEAFLFPSLIEGFGLPVIEAMRFGKPVFCSNRSSLPEVGSDCAFYWDSFDPKTMKETFCNQFKIFKDNESELSNKNIKHSMKFKWEECVNQYQEVYDEVVQTQYNMKSTDHQAVVHADHESKNLVIPAEGSIRVLHLSSEKSWRGGEQQIAYLIDELNKLGIRNHIACRKNSIFEKYCQEKDWDHYSLNFNPPFDIHTAFQISRICKKNQIDILHMHTSYGHTLGILSSLFGNQAKLVLSRRVDNPIRNNWFTSWKYNHPQIEKIITVSDAIREILKKKLKDRSKLTTIHSGIDISKFDNIQSRSFLREKHQINEDTILIGNTSALSDHKDYPTFIKVARHLIDQGINAKFLIIGTGELNEIIRKIIIEEHLEEHVIMTGFLNNITTILPELDIFLMPSKTEGLGTSILDAFACEVPVVTTYAGGIPEMVIHEETGMLSDVKDYKSLGNNIIRLLNDQELQKKIIKNAKDYLINNFLINNTALKTLNVYDSILLISKESQ